MTEQKKVFRTMLMSRVAALKDPFYRSMVTEWVCQALKEETQCLLCEHTWAGDDGQDLASDPPAAFFCAAEIEGGLVSPLCERCAGDISDESIVPLAERCCQMLGEELGGKWNTGNVIGRKH